MTDIIKTLTNIRSLRATLRDLPYDLVSDITDKVIQVRDELKIEEQKRVAQEREKQEKVKSVLELMAEDGLTVDDLQGAVTHIKPSSTGKVSKENAPYRYTDEQGKVKYWTGRGRKPQPIKTALDNGEPLEQFENPDYTG